VVTYYFYRCCRHTHAGEHLDTPTVKDPWALTDTHSLCLSVAK